MPCIRLEVTTSEEDGPWCTCVEIKADHDTYFCLPDSQTYEEAKYRATQYLGDLQRTVLKVEEQENSTTYHSGRYKVTVQRSPTNEEVFGTQEAP